MSTSPPPHQPPPGWYPDPAEGGWQRYWNGLSWTEQRAPLAPPGSFAPSQQASRSRDMAMLAHLSALLSGLVGGLIFVGPLLMYLLKRGEDPFVDAHIAESLNFSLSVTIYAVVGALATVVLMLVLIGLLLIPLLIAGAIAWLVLVIQAAMRAKRGEPVSYPLAIRFVGG